MELSDTAQNFNAKLAGFGPDNPSFIFPEKRIRTLEEYITKAKKFRKMIAESAAAGSGAADCLECESRSVVHFWSWEIFF